MATRYIGNQSGTGDGTSVANRAPWSAIDAMVSQAGPGGELRIVDDGTPIQVNSAPTLSHGGASGNRLKMRGVGMDGLTKGKPIFTANRTHPWPTDAAAARAANDGNSVLRFATGASHIEIFNVKFRACGITLVVVDSAEVDDIWLGYANLLDLLTHNQMLAFRTNFPRWTRASAEAVAAAAQLKEDCLARAPAAGTFEDAIEFENCLRGFDVGIVSSATGYTSTGGVPARVTNFRWVGGRVDGCARGAFRIRGNSDDAIVQDVVLDAQYQKDKNNSICEGFEANGYSPGNNGIRIFGADDVHFIRVQSDHTSNNDPDGGYTNGDSFTSERENERVTYTCCSGSDNHDGGIDSKAVDLLLFYPKFLGGRRPLRVWPEYGYAYDIDLTDPDWRRAGGDRAFIYSDGSGMMVICSGVCRYTSAYNPPSDPPGGDFCFLTENGAFLAVSTAVTVEGFPAPYNSFRGTAAGSFNISYDPADTAAPTVTSSAAISATEGTASAVSLTANKPVRFYLADSPGPDFELFNLENTYNALRLPAKKFDDPLDANGDNVYQVNVVARTPQGGISAPQTISFTVNEAVFTPVDILGRMAARGSAAPTELQAAYTNAAQRMADERLLLYLDGLQITSHSDLASRENWANPSATLPHMGQDGSRSFPWFVAGEGYKAASGRWGYDNSGFARFNSEEAMAGVISPGLGSGAIYGGSGPGSSNASVSASNGNAVCRPHSPTAVTVPDAFEGDGFVGWERRGTAAIFYVDGEEALSQTVTAPSGTTSPSRFRFGARDNSSSSEGHFAPNPIKAAWHGTPMPPEKWAVFYDILMELLDAIEAYWATKAPQFYINPTMLGVVAANENVTLSPGTANRNGGANSFGYEINDGSGPTDFSTGQGLSLTIDEAGSQIRGWQTKTDSVPGAPTTSSRSYTPWFAVAYPPPTFFLAPVAQGDGTGSTAENARAFSEINALAMANPNSVIKLRADLGDYILPFAYGISASNMVFDSHHPTNPEILAVLVGNRPEIFNPAVSVGFSCFNVSGNNNIFRRLHFKNFGGVAESGSSAGSGGAIVAATGLNGFTVEDCVMDNVYRGVELLSFACQNITVRRNRVIGIERALIRMAGNISNCLVEDNYADADFQTGDSFPSLYQLGGTNGQVIRNVIFRRNKSFNVYFPIYNPDGSEAYYNGDNYETDDGNSINGTLSGVLFEDCEADYATDANYDVKGIPEAGYEYAVRFNRTIGRGAKRGYKLFGGPFILDNINSAELTDRGGVGNSNHFGMYRAGSTAIINNPVIDDSGHAVVNIEFPNCRMVINNLTGYHDVPGRALVVNNYDRADHPDNYSEVIFNPPPEGYDQYGQPIDGERPYRTYGPYLVTVTDELGNEAEVMWGPITVYGPPS